MRAPHVLLPLVLIACQGHGHELVVAPLPATELATGSAAAPFHKRLASRLDLVVSEEHEVFSLLDQYTRDVIGSPEFRTALERFPQVDARPGAGWISGHTLARAYLGELAGYAPAQTCFLRKPGWGATAATDIAKQCGAIGGTYAVIAVRGVVLDRITALPEGRACAINTLAHEWTHGIVDNNGHMVFLDAGYQHFDDAVVSYTVGAIAQCVYLQRWRPDLDLDACVRAAGTHAFRGCTCEPGWLDALIAGDTSCKDPSPASRRSR